MKILEELKANLNEIRNSEITIAIDEFINLIDLTMKNINNEVSNFDLDTRDLFQTIADQKYSPKITGQARNLISIVDKRGQKTRGTLKEVSSVTQIMQQLTKPPATGDAMDLGIEKAFSQLSFGSTPSIEDFEPNARFNFNPKSSTKPTVEARKTSAKPRPTQNSIAKRNLRTSTASFNFAPSSSEEEAVSQNMEVDDNESLILEL